MQISIETKILENIFTYATNAARLIDDMDKNIVDDELSESVNQICRTVARLLGKSYDAEPEEASTQDGEFEFDVADAVDDLRQLVARVDALITAAESHLDEMIWSDDDVNRRQLERLAHLVGATGDAVENAMEASDQLAIDLRTHRPES